MKSDKTYNIGNSFAYIFYRSVYNTKNKSNIFVNGHRRDQTEILKYKSESTAKFRYFAFFQLAKIIAVYGT